VNIYIEIFNSHQQNSFTDYTRSGWVGSKILHIMALYTEVIRGQQNPFTTINSNSQHKALKANESFTTSGEVTLDCFHKIKWKQRENSTPPKGEQYRTFLRKSYHVYLDKKYYYSLPKLPSKVTTQEKFCTNLE